MSVAQDIEDLVGHEALCVLVVHYGGQSLHISRKSESRLSQILGGEKARKIVFNFRGETIDVPTMNQVRSAKMRLTDTLIQDLSTTEIAQRLGVTRQHARRIKNEA